MRTLFFFFSLWVGILGYPGQSKIAASIYNDARLIFHAIGPKFPCSQLEGIDPAKSLEVMELTLGQFVEKNPDYRP